MHGVQSFNGTVAIVTFASGLVSLQRMHSLGAFGGALGGGRFGAAAVVGGITSYVIFFV